MPKFMQNSLIIFIFASVLIHLGMWVGLQLSKTPSFLSAQKKVEIVILDQSPHRQIDAKKMQIVEQNEKPLNDETPDDAKFLSKNNQRVVKESVAQKAGDFKNTGKKIDSEKSVKQASIEPQPKSTTTNSKIMRGSLPTLSDLRPKFDPNIQRDMNPTKDASQSEASRTNDYLKNTPPSLETVLNTREFVYYTYYQRIRTQIRQYWEPSIREKVRKIFAQGRSLASEHDHVTRVVIILDKDGGLLRVKIVGESGLKDLDDAAVEAFRAAEPFPNPPKGIVEQDGTIKINWDFVLEANLFITPDSSKQRYATHKVLGQNI